MAHVVAVKFLGFLERVAGHRETRVEIKAGVYLPLMPAARG